MRELSTPVYFVRAVLRHTVDVGLDPLQLLRDNRISPRLLESDEAYVSIERLADLEHQVMLQMRDEALGYQPRRMPVGTWTMLCHSVIGSDTLGQALARYCRFFGLFESGLTPRFSIEDERAVIRLHAYDPDFDYEMFAAEQALWLCHRFAIWLTRTRLPLQQASMAYPTPRHLPAYRQIFLGGPVEFDRPCNEMRFDQGLLDLPVVQNELSLRRFLRHPLLTMMTQRYDQDSWSARVKNILRRDLQSMPELDAVAEQLALHPQTLRRRLAAEGVTFKDLKTLLRRDVALHYLGKRGLSIEEIAYRAGFSESSAFIRAFKNWTGLTPYTYRKGL